MKSDSPKSELPKNSVIKENSIIKNAPFHNEEMQKLELSILKLKESMKSSDSLRNSKILGNKAVDKNSEFDNISNGKYLGHASNFIKDKNIQAERLNRLGGNTIQFDSKMIKSRIKEGPRNTIFGVATYRRHKENSFDNDSGDDDTLERASNPESANVKALNSSRNQYDRSLVLTNEMKQSSDNNKATLTRDKSASKPLYCIANTVKSFNSREREADRNLTKSSRNQNSFMNKVRAKNEKQLGNMDYFSFSSPTREFDKENSTGQSKIRNCYPDSQLYPTFVYSNECKLESEMISKAKNNMSSKSLNKSLKMNNNQSAERNLDDEPITNYMLVNEQELNPLITDSFIAEKGESWNERAKKLSKELQTYSSRDTIDNVKVNIQEKLKILVKNAKKNSFIQSQEDHDDSYHYKSIP